MGAEYQAVLWNRQKKIYDGIILISIAAYIATFTIITSLYHPQVTPPTLIIRSTGSLALVMLHVILIIGPLCRLDKRFLPLLYNRRHLGVMTFLVALIHGGFSILQFHAFGEVSPLVSVLISNTHYGSLMRFPFQSLGLGALVILFLMAASSHDFWLQNLGPMVWKWLHMTVYLAYVLIIMHVMLGVIQLENSPWLIGALATGMLMVITLHILSGLKTYQEEKGSKIVEKEELVRVCRIDDIRENRATLMIYAGQSIAIFRYQQKVSAVSNSCKHQNGPLSEGKIVDGCITCPWHGYQYFPESGTSPPPFEEKIATYAVKIIGNDIWVDPKPNPPGTRISPGVIGPEL